MQYGPSCAKVGVMEFVTVNVTVWFIGFPHISLMFVTVRVYVPAGKAGVMVRSIPVVLPFTQFEFKTLTV